MNNITATRVALGLEVPACRTCRWAETVDGHGCAVFGGRRGGSANQYNSYFHGIRECEPYRRWLLWEPRPDDWKEP